MSVLKITNGMVLDGIHNEYGADTVSFENVTIPIEFVANRADSDFWFAKAGERDPEIHGDAFGAGSVFLTRGDDVFANIEDSGIPNIHGGDGNDILAGSSYSNGVLLDGGNGNDVLWGNSPDRDTLTGGAGDDELHIVGADKATGGAGADKFIFDASPYLLQPFGGSAFLCDFKASGAGHDVIDLSGPLVHAGYNYASFSQAEAAGTLGITYLHGYTYLSFDSDGNHAPDQEIAHIKGVILPDFLDQDILATHDHAAMV
jgi:Ca2+-binding RTX toxin-like protein